MINPAGLHLHGNRKTESNFKSYVDDENTGGGICSDNAGTGPAKEITALKMGMPVTVRAVVPASLFPAAGKTELLFKAALHLAG